MNKKAIMAVVGSMVFLLAIVMPASAVQASTISRGPFTLYAGQDIPVGDVKVVLDESEGYMYVTFTVWDCLKLEEMHLAVSSSLAGIPHTKTGNPIPGQFDYSKTGVLVSTYTFKVPYDGCHTTYIAAHAVVVMDPCCTCGPCCNCVPGFGYYDEETAWAGCNDFPGANWATYIVCNFC